ncbi:MAG TPA: HRDC domain-containing protein [Pyrinomonadaceae bacterium]|nr:HRDC domain-containing protein [Pyrinomonadaceae bacterium]
MSKEFTYRYIADAAEAAAAAEKLLGETLVSLDTETYWNRAASTSHVSLVQIAAAGHEVLVFDFLSVGAESLRPLVESPAVAMAAHNARFDQGVLRGEGFAPQTFVDTLSLARDALTLPSYSLASVTEHLFGLPLDKTLQRSNWARRPLTRAQLEYAALDAHITLLVYEELRRRLEAEGRWEASARAATISSAPRAAGTATRRRRKPAEAGPPLTEEERRTVGLLKRWRTQRANAQRVPAYMICPDKTLECLARERPETLEQLRSVYGLGDSKIERFGEDLLAALRDATSDLS